MVEFSYLYFCVFLVLLTSLWEAYLSWRQRNVYKTVTKVPQELVNVFDQETFDKSRVYQLDKSTYSSIQSLYKLVEFIVILYLGALPMVWNVAGSMCTYIGYGPDYEVIRTGLFVLVCLVYSDVTGLPWNAYYIFVLEEKHGFNKQTLGFFIKDTIKKFILQSILIPLITCGVVFIVKWGGPYFYVYAWLFVFIVTLVFIMLYHDFIAPCFDKYTPLPDCELRTKIEELATTLSFPLKKLYVVEGSKRSAHSNAYFYGFGSNKRIVLFDTLIEKGILPEEEEKKEKKEKEEEEEEKEKEGMEEKEGENEKENEKEGQKEEKVNEQVTEGEGKSGDSNKKEDKDNKSTGCNIEEILAVLAHELGHWYYSHTIKFIALSQVNTFLSFALFGYFLNQQDMYTSFGFPPDSRPVIIGLLIVFEMIFTPYNALFMFLIVQVGRRFEYQADAFAGKMNRARPLSHALTKLVKDNLSFPVADYLYANFHNVHPTFLERIRALDDMKQD